MVSSHISVKLTDSTVQGNISVLSVHVVISSSGLISGNDAECFDVIRSSFEDLVN